MKQQLFVVTAAISFAFTAPTFAQSTPSSPAPQKSAAQQCKDLTGTALDACLKAAPGRSGDAASREGGSTPGASESAASRSGGAPGKGKSGADATGSTSGGAAGKGAGQSY